MFIAHTVPIPITLHEPKIEKWMKKVCFCRALSNYKFCGPLFWVFFLFSYGREFLPNHIQIWETFKQTNFLTSQQCSKLLLNKMASQYSTPVFNEILIDKSFFVVVVVAFGNYYLHNFPLHLPSKMSFPQKIKKNKNKEISQITVSFQWNATNVKTSHPKSIANSFLFVFIKIT